MANSQIIGAGQGTAHRAPKKYQIIYADPPWKQKAGRKLDNYKVVKGKQIWNSSTSTTEDLPYPTMTVEEIAALPVKKIASKDAHLYLWVTNKYLLQANEIIKAWGFRYVATVVWKKKRMGGGLGGAVKISSEYLLVCRRGNLKAIGVSDERIHFVGNTMIDTLLKHRKRFIRPEIFDRIGLKDAEYFVVTLHRPANVDEEYKLKELIDEIMNHTRKMPVVFPVHPRTAKILERIGVSHPRLHLTEPLGYLEFNYLVERSMAVITDSGGITEETTVMGIPCMTLRNSTERPETISIGTNELLGVDPQAIAPALEKLFSGEWKKGEIPPLWDGKTSGRIVSRLIELYD
jgi:N6-adenosine-specific RNA methylase IME4